MTTSCFHLTPDENRINLAETELKEAKAAFDRLDKQADIFQAELHALKAFLREPPDDVTVRELKIIDQRKIALEMELAAKWKEMEPAYHRARDARIRFEDLRGETVI